MSCKANFVNKQQLKFVTAKVNIDSMETLLRNLLATIELTFDWQCDNKIGEFVFCNIRNEADFIITDTLLELTTNGIHDI